MGSNAATAGSTALLPPREERGRSASNWEPSGMPHRGGKRVQVLHGRACARGSSKDKPADDILAVDDDPETLALVAEALEEQGFAVRRASSGREALETMAKHPPTVAIIDLIMPEVGGEEVCAELRRNPRFMGTRILVLSGAEDTRVVAASCDADGAVTKPFTTELLVHEVRRLIGQ